jgi:hypothetical protein
MVNAVNWGSTPAINSLVDPGQWDRLAGLGDKYREGEKRQLLSQLGDDPEANKRLLLGSGDPALAQLGLNYQQKDIDRLREDARNAVTDRRADSADKRAGAYLGIAQSQEGRAAAKAAEDTPEFRRQRLIDAGMNADDPNFKAHVATGAALPTPIALEIENRNKVKFEQEQKYATREQRLQAVKDGELDINEPDIRRWVALGGDMPDPAKQRLGLGAPTYTKDAEGNIRAYQLSATGVPVEVKLPEGQRVLGPGEIAQQKSEGTVTGKAVAGAKTSLPDVIRQTDAVIEHLDELIGHGSKKYALGLFSAAPDVMVAGTGVANFRERVKQLAGDAMAQTMASLKGAGLGSVSDFEQQNMIKAFVRAGMAQNEKDFDESMKAAKKSAEKIREIARNKAKGDFSVAPAAVPSGGKPPLGSIIPLN